MARPSAEAQRRRQILSATCEVIAEQGFRSLRVSDVAARIGTATGTVHYYFPTKRDLLHAAFEFNFRSSLERRRPILESDDDPLVKLRAFVDSYLPIDPVTVQAWRVWAALWNEAIHEPDLQELNESVYGEWRAVVAGIIRDGQARGVVRGGDAVVLANLLIGLIDGLSIQVILGSRAMNADRMRRICHHFIDEFIQQPGPESADPTGPAFAARQA
ncbi:TetR family transcriptional regulator [Thermobispora bispora]|uniref:Transcriptional regulator, TetR family n=1 Tax=Thermobispora bispora (strain ATCC 19993 / DSM 43833 / CBS 139.67 / JCM 10125 / KCTC 9307 / NBRC 14880 / R51) TaxID=469371 RepID=D6YAT8_THEBD|nr:TetR/AcrR family transcriptional regulator [Thermobispora bispora]ADG88305.1 transcriptional regulator, TetR family [Thermobispora bispora DSM 43833]MBO2474909.1 TetR family transcriptional regulator [Actinomycetales bacterium]MDI9580252.1 TetR/AcrR family transcriptional regulator [Thermobispora sp.]QSI48130.1 TetR family transcriptional regulator [Thermobispora bispora]